MFNIFDFFIFCSTKFGFVLKNYNPIHQSRLQSSDALNMWPFSFKLYKKNEPKIALISFIHFK